MRVHSFHSFSGFIDFHRLSVQKLIIFTSVSDDEIAFFTCSVTLHVESSMSCVHTCIYTHILCDAGVPEHGHGEPLGEHVHDEGPQGVQARQLVGQVHPACLLPKLEEQDPCIYGWGGAMREIHDRWRWR